MAGRLRRLLRRLRPPRRLRFTREGKVFCLFTVGIGFAAINTGNNLLFLLLGWMLSVIVASGVLSELALRGLAVRRSTPGRVFTGRPFLLGITVHNRKKRLPSFSIEVEDLLGDRPLDKKCYFLKIPAGREQTASYRHTFARRGLHRLSGVRLSTRFPFTLFRKSRDLAVEDEILVYPRTRPVEVPPPGPLLGGEDSRARLGRRGEFFGLRELRQGDDRRDVHWRSSARAGRLMVREYEQESHRRATLLVDNGLSPSASPRELDALEEAIELAASLAQAYLARGYVVGLLARGDRVPAASGPPQLDRILRALALLPAVPPDTPFAGPVPPNTDATLVARRGAAPAERPAGVTRVVEAGP